MDTPDFSSYLNDDHDLLASAATETPMDWLSNQEGLMAGGSGSGSAWDGYAAFPPPPTQPYSPLLASSIPFNTSPSTFTSPAPYQPTYAPTLPITIPTSHLPPQNMSFVSPSALMPIPDTHLSQPSYQPLAFPGAQAKSVPVSVFGSTNGDSDSGSESDTSFDEDEGDELRQVSGRRVSQAGSLSGSVGGGSGFVGWGSMGLGAGSVGSLAGGVGEGKRPNKRARCESELGSVGVGMGRSVSGSSVAGGRKKGSKAGDRRSSTRSGSARPTFENPMFSLPSLFTTSLPGQPHPGTGKKPWNTTPLSTHLPSGSQLINPLTNELDLKPELLEGLTKEEVRKVKNRASAQRSRTRKWEMQEGMRGECERLRDELDGVRAELEEALGGRPGGGGGRAMGSEEKEAMEALIVRLRGEVHREKEARVQAESELHSLRAQLDSLLRQPSLVAPAALPIATHTPASSLSGGSYGIPSPSRSSEPEHDLSTDGSLAGSMLLEAAGGDVMDGGRAEKGEMMTGEGMGMTVSKKNAKGRVGKDGKGVLMMVVLFSFALFSLPPHLRSSHPAFHLSSSNTQGRVLPFQNLQSGSLLLKNVTRQGDVEVVVVNPDEETDGCAADGNTLCPAKKPEMQMLGVGTRKGDTARGRKSFSFTLLRPMAEGEEDVAVGSAPAEKKAERAQANLTDSEVEVNEGGNVEDVLSRWLGLSLFDAGLGVAEPKESKSRASNGHVNASGEGSSTAEQSKDQFVPGGWVVVDSSVQDSQGQGFFRAPSQPSVSSPLADIDMDSTGSPQSPEIKALTAWDGSRIEMMDLDTEVLSISAPSQTPQATLGMGPDPSKTLAPQVLEDPLADEDAGSSGFVLPGAYPDSPRSGRGAGAMPSAALMALGRSGAERYMKLELEMDIEVEVRTVGLRRKGGSEMGSKQSGEAGLTVVGREEVGRMLKLSSGASGMGLSLPAGEGEMGSGWTML